MFKGCRNSQAASTISIMVMRICYEDGDEDGDHEEEEEEDGDDGDGDGDEDW